MIKLLSVLAMSAMLIGQIAVSTAEAGQRYQRHHHGGIPPAVAGVVGFGLGYLAGRLDQPRYVRRPRHSVQPQSRIIYGQPEYIGETVCSARGCVFVPAKKRAPRMHRHHRRGGYDRGLQPHEMCIDDFLSGRPIGGPGCPQY